MAKPKRRNPLSEIELATFDALTTVMEVFLALGISPEYLAAPLKAQRDGHRKKNHPDAAAAFDYLLDYVADPDVARRRKMLGLFRTAPPEGTA